MMTQTTSPTMTCLCLNNHGELTLLPDDDDDSIPNNLMCVRVELLTAFIVLREIIRVKGNVCTR